MQVGALISALEPYQGRGDTVQVWSTYTGEHLDITHVEWDPVTKVVSIKTVFVPVPMLIDCECEGASAIHHIDGTYNNDLSNIAILCVQCGKEKEAKGP